MSYTFDCNDSDDCLINLNNIDTYCQTVCQECSVTNYLMMEPFTVTGTEHYTLHLNTEGKYMLVYVCQH